MIRAWVWFEFGDTQLSEGMEGLGCGFRDQGMRFIGFRLCRFEGLKSRV